MWEYPRPIDLLRAVAAPYMPIVDQSLLYRPYNQPYPEIDLDRIKQLGGSRSYSLFDYLYPDDDFHQCVDMFGDRRYPDYGQCTCHYSPYRVSLEEAIPWMSAKQVIEWLRLAIYWSYQEEDELYQLQVASDPPLADFLRNTPQWNFNPDTLELVRELAFSRMETGIEAFFKK